MKARLSSLELLPRGADGLAFPAHRFGAITTFILGANGAGKTPLARAIAFALGNPTPLPDDVQKRCSHVILSLSDGTHTYRVSRPTSGSFAAECTDADGSTKTFADAATFSAWLLERLGLPLRQFAGKGGSQAAVAPYTSVLLPVCFADQDFGWTTLYAAKENFIEDQPEEMLRWVLGLAPKRMPVDKKAFEEAKHTLGGIKERIVFKRRALEALVREVGGDAKPDRKAELVATRERLLAEIGSTNVALETIAKTESHFDVAVRDAMGKRDALQTQLDFGKRRRAEIVRVRDELSSEVDVLHTNEVAADAFRTLCGNDACGFFRRPDESYGRRLLYLKDQLKDFETSSTAVERELAELTSRLDEAKTAADGAASAKVQSLASTGADRLVRMVQAQTRELADVSIRVDRIERIEKERAQLEALINQEARAQEEVERLRPHGGRKRADDRVLDARALLASSMIEWMDALNTQNVPRDVQFDEELRLLIGGKPLGSRFSGSTLTRLVIAHHSAVVEASLSLGGTYPSFLILDAPKQQELHAQDLAAFITRFYALSKKHGSTMQLVIAATDPAIIPDGRADETWKPGFGTAEKPRYLGTA